MDVRRAVHWKICADPALKGLEANWQGPVPLHAVAAPVTGIIQQVFPDYQGVAWYWCEVAPFAVAADHRALVRFESVDYAARVWVKGHELGSHDGGGLADAAPRLHGQTREAKTAPVATSSVLAGRRTRRLSRRRA